MNKLIFQSKQLPTLLIISLTLLCLFLFWLTIPLPRVDGQLVGSDGIGYYIYLPSSFIDGDLDFTNDYTIVNEYLPEELERILTPSALTPIGRPANQWPIGTAVIWLPFFLLAHGAAHLFNALGFSFDTSGYSYFYQTIVLTGSILFGGLGLWLTYAFSCNLTNSKASLIATLSVVLAGNIIYYMTAEPSMSHNISLFLSGLFFYTWQRHYNEEGIRTAVFLGAIGGFMALVRPQDGLFLALPFLARVPDAWHSLRGQKPKSVWQHWLRDSFVAGIAAIIIFSPQFIVWGRVYGNYFHSPYTYYAQKTLFFWFSPRLGETLFSAARGLVTWHPIFLLALIGLFILSRQHKNWAILGFLGFFMQWYVISSWHMWTQGDAFGGRMFIVCTPIFVMGLASLIDWVGIRASWKLIYVAMLLLIGWNFLLFVEYRLDLVLTERLPTWTDITIRRFTFPLEKILPRINS